MIGRDHLSTTVWCAELLGEPQRLLRACPCILYSPDRAIEFRQGVRLVLNCMQIAELPGNLQRLP
jgi:hypothetical protein